MYQLFASDNDYMKEFIFDSVSRGTYVICNFMHFIQ